MSGMWASLVAQAVKNLPVMQDTQVQSLGGEDPLEKGVATHAGTLAWRIPWTEEPDRPQSPESQKAGHNWTTYTLAEVRSEDEINYSTTPLSNKSPLFRVGGVS